MRKKIRNLSVHMPDRTEARDILVSALVLAFVFSVAWNNGVTDFYGVIKALPAAMGIVSLGFVLHELSHRFVARKYDCRAEYKMWKEGLIIAAAITLLTNGSFVFAAPGAVMIYPRADLWGHVKELSRKRFGLISIAGPLTNVALAGAFFAANFFHPSQAFMLGIQVNIWLALFNMIPIPPLDGSKVLAWDKRVWLALFAVLAALFFIRF